MTYDRERTSARVQVKLRAAVLEGQLQRLAQRLASFDLSNDNNNNGDDNGVVQLRRSKEMLERKLEALTREEDPEGERFKPEKHIFYCNACSKEISPDSGRPKRMRMSDRYAREIQFLVNTTQ